MTEQAVLILFVSPFYCMSQAADSCFNANASQILGLPQNTESMAMYATFNVQPKLSAGSDDAGIYDDDGADLLLEEAKPALKAPSMYRVIMFNDDYTPMDFVIEVLERYFNHNRESATQIMLAVHTQGKAVCGLFTRDIAETKAMQVNQYARESQHPLLCEIERDG